MIAKSRRQGGMFSCHDRPRGALASAGADCPRPGDATADDRVTVICDKTSEPRYPVAFTEVFSADLIWRPFFFEAAAAFPEEHGARARCALLGGDRQTSSHTNHQ